MSAKHVENVVRTLGGGLYLSGVLIMVYNLWRTVRGDVRAREEVPDLPAQAALQPAQ